MNEVRPSQSDPLAALHRQFIAAVMSADVPAIVALYSDTAVLMPPNDTSLFGKRELEEWHREYFESFRVSVFEEVEREVEVFEACIVERWAYLVAIEPVGEGDRIRDDGRFLIIWKKEKGEWLISQAMFNSIRPIGSGTSRFLARLSKKKH